MECGEKMALGLLKVHQKTKHRKEAGGMRHWENTAPGGYPQTYKIDFPSAGAPRNCPIKGCRGRVVTRTAMQVHFLYQHVRDTVIILEEGNLPHPHFPWCNMMVP